MATMPQPSASLAPSSQNCSRASRTTRTTRPLPPPRQGLLLAPPTPSTPHPANPTPPKPNPADAVPTPRAKPQVAATLQLASADARAAQAPKPKQAAAEATEPKPQTPTDIINARGFWDDNAVTPTQATPAQMIAIINARRTLDAAADPQATASVPAAYQAMAYAPDATPPAERPNVVAASAPVPRSARPASSRNVAPATEINTVATKGAQGQGDMIANATRLSAAKGNDLWMRIMMLAPSASTSMSVAVMGDSDLRMMSAFFIKPPAAVAITFSDDPMMGMSTDHFSGSATTKTDPPTLALPAAAVRSRTHRPAASILAGRPRASEDP